MIGLYSWPGSVAVSFEQDKITGNYVTADYVRAQRACPGTPTLPELCFLPMLAAANGATCPYEEEVLGAEKSVVIGAAVERCRCSASLLRHTTPRGPSEASRIVVVSQSGAISN